MLLTPVFSFSSRYFRYSNVYSLPLVHPNQGSLSWILNTKVCLIHGSFFCLTETPVAFIFLLLCLFAKHWLHTLVPDIHTLSPPMFSPHMTYPFPTNNLWDETWFTYIPSSLCASTSCAILIPLPFFSHRCFLSRAKFYNFLYSMTMTLLFATPKYGNFFTRFPAHLSIKSYT